MTKKKSPEGMSEHGRKQLDTTPKPRRPRRGVTPEKTAARAERLDNLRPNGTKAEVALLNPDRPLTEKMKLFVKFWAQGESILSASYRAGYSDNGTVGYRLAKDPAILKIYHYEKALYEEAAQMTRKRVMEGFLEAAEMAKIQGDPTALTGAWREIGKMCGYYEPVKRTINVNLTGNVTMKTLEAASNEDLLKLIKGEVEDVAFKEVDDEDNGEQP